MLLKIQIFPCLSPNAMVSMPLVKWDPNNKIKKSLRSWKRNVNQNVAAAEWDSWELCVFRFLSPHTTQTASNENIHITWMPLISYAVVYFAWKIYGIFYLYFNTIFARCEKFQFEWMAHWIAWIQCKTNEYSAARELRFSECRFHEARLMKTVFWVRLKTSGRMNTNIRKGCILTF